MRFYNKRPHFLTYSEDFSSKKPADLLRAHFNSSAASSNNYALNSFALVGAIQDEDGNLSLRDYYYFATILRTFKNLGISVAPNSRIDIYNLADRTNFLGRNTPQTDCVLLCNLNYLNATQSPDLLLTALKSAYKEYNEIYRLQKYYQLVAPFEARHLQADNGTTLTKSIHPAEIRRWTEAMQKTKPKIISSWGHDHHLQAADVTPTALKALISQPDYDFRNKSTPEAFLTSIALCFDEKTRNQISQSNTPISRPTTAARLTNQTLSSLSP